MAERKNVNPNFQVKPMRLYEEEVTSIRNLKEGDLVIAKAVSYNNGTVLLTGDGFDAEMESADFNPYNTYEKNEKNLISLIGKNVLTRVKKKEGTNYLFLEHESIIRDTYQVLSGKIGEVVEATVEAILPYALYIDIGNGVISMLHVNQVSVARYYDLNNIFLIGDTIKVRIMDLNLKKCFFEVSRKDAYNKLIFKKNTCIEAICAGALKDDSGIFIEYDPNNIGIMDVPKNMSSYEFFEGKRVIVSIKGQNNNGFKANFFCFAD